MASSARRQPPGVQRARAGACPCGRAKVTAAGAVGTKFWAEQKTTSSREIRSAAFDGVHLGVRSIIGRTNMFLLLLKTNTFKFQRVLLHFRVRQDMPSTIDELLKSKRQEVLAIAARHGAHNVRVFGSVARGEARPESDLDILVEVGQGTSLTDHVTLMQDLEALLERKVHLISDRNPARVYQGPSARRSLRLWD
jgi:predicted nucleotidyltransferase